MPNFAALSSAALMTAMLLAWSASAETVYDGLAEDNPDLRGEGPEIPMDEPGPDPAADVYSGVAENNPDLPSDVETTKPPTKADPDIYEDIEPNPDLRTEERAKP